jgi:hypothetical protein
MGKNITENERRARLRNLKFLMRQRGIYPTDVMRVGPRGGKGDQDKGLVIKKMTPLTSSTAVKSDSVKLGANNGDESGEWPKIWDSDGSIPAFTNLREPKHEWGIHHYPVFQKAVNLGYPLHNFKVYVSDTDYFYSKFDPIKLYDWKNKAVLYENNRGTDQLPSDVESDIRNVSMDYENEPYFTQIFLHTLRPSYVEYHLIT